MRSEARHLPERPPPRPAAPKVPLPPTDPDAPRDRVLVRESTPGYTDISVFPGPVDIEATKLPDGTPVSRVHMPGLRNLKRPDSPSLPVLRTDLIVPPGATPRLVVTAMETHAVPAPPPMPSAGFVSRSAVGSPELRFGSAYRKDVFPARVAELRPAYRIRSVTGIGVVTYPVRYDPANGSLIVADRIDLRILHPADGRPSLRTPRGPFETIVRARFANADDALKPDADGVPRAGAAGDSRPGTVLLIIVPDGRTDTVAEFADWKRRRGLTVRVAEFPADAGAPTVAGLGALIRAAYETQDTTHVLLVGDTDTIPTDTAAAGPTFPSDVVFSLLSGSDLYPDVLISRIPLSNPTALAPVLDKLIRLERAPPAGNTAAGAVLIGSAQKGISAFGLTDREQLEQESLRLETFGMQVARLYDPGVLSDSVSNAFAPGTGLAYYLGHGEPGLWQTGKFTSNRAATVTTASGMCPFVVSAACDTGNFAYSVPCLGEEFLRNISGASGFLGATGDMDWDPPIVMLEAFTAYLTQAPQFSAGGFPYDGWQGSPSAGTLTTLAVQRAVDYCVAAGLPDTLADDRILVQTHLLGDGTLELRTGPPRSLTVEYPPRVLPAVPFDVRVTDAVSGEPIRDADVCLYLPDEWHSVHRTDETGKAVCTVQAPLHAHPFLTVFRADAIPVETSLEIGADALTVLGPDRADVIIGTPFSLDLVPAGETPPCTWTCTTPTPLPGNTPPAIDAALGILTWNPQHAESLTVRVTVTDASAAQATKDVTLRAGHAVAIRPDPLPAAAVGAPYGALLRAEGDFPPFGFALGSGTLPDGLNLTASGALEGTPLQAGSFPFRVTVTDAAGTSSAADITLVCQPAGSLTILTAAKLPDAQLGDAYRVVLDATGGIGTPFAWAVTSGAPPPGVTLSAEGVLEGAPSDHGTYLFEATVSDRETPPNQRTGAFRLVVHAAVRLTATTMPDARRGTPYEEDIPAIGSFTPLTFAPGPPDGYEMVDGAPSFEHTGDAVRFAGDETELTVAIGFPFPFHGVTYTQCRIGDNGYVVFGNGPPAGYLWLADGDVLAQLRMIAPLWTDLVFPSTLPDAGVRIRREADSITFSWRGLDYHYAVGDVTVGDGNPDLVETALTLRADGRVRFAYGTVRTSNRAVCGMSGGTPASAVTLLDNDWIPQAPVYVPDWSRRPDVLFIPGRPLPPGLTITPDGRLLGTPATAGTFRFPVSVRDDALNHAAAELTLTVAEYVPDTDGDGRVGNRELLEFLALYEQGRVTDTQAEAAVDQWRTTGFGEARGLTKPMENGRGAPLPARGPTAGHPSHEGETVSVLAVPVRDRDEAVALLREGFDVADYTPGEARVYVPECRLAELLERDPPPQILETQIPGGRAPMRGTVGFPTPEEVVARLDSLEQQYPDLCRTVVIGRTHGGRPVMAVKITDNPDAAEPEPEVRISAGIHGDEPVTTDMCLDFAAYLLQAYSRADAEGERVRHIVDGTEIWLFPVLNPDGLAAGTRYNAVNVDLNRAFPDGVLETIGSLSAYGDAWSPGREPEVAAIMRHAAARRTVASVTLHSGALRVCYPYGNNAQGTATETPTPDDDAFRYLAEAYAGSHTEMRALASPPGGVINAAAWYPVVGEMGDWMYRFAGTLELTAEISSEKAPDAALLPVIRALNLPPLLAFLEAAGTGIAGTVRLPYALPRDVPASVDLGDGRALIATDPGPRTFFRPLPPGVYELTAGAPGCAASLPLTCTILPGEQAAALAVLDPAPEPVAVRRFLRPRFRPATPHEVNLDVFPGNTPNTPDLIVNEVLPPGWSVVPGSSFLGATPLPEPKQEGPRRAWLIRRGTPGPARLTYDAMAPAELGPEPGPLFAGNAESLHTETLTGGYRLRDAETPDEFILELRAGWNLASLPILPDNRATVALPPEAGVLALREWTGRSYRAPTRLEPGQAYWIFAEEAGSIAVAGAGPGETLRMLPPGWQLVGPIAALPVSAIFPSGTPVWEWQSGYRRAAVLQPGRGYWVFNSAARVINLMGD